MSLSLISNATLYCTFSTGSSGCGASACSLDYPAILRDLFPSHSGEVNTRLWPPKCRKTVARARSKVARYRAQGGVTIACIAIPRQSVGEGCDGNRFRGRVHMGSGDWRVWKTLFNPGKALKRSDGHRGAGEEYTQLRSFGRRPHALYGQTVNLFLASVISPHNSCKLRCQQLRFQRRQPAVSNIFPSCR